MAKDRIVLVLMVFILFAPLTALAIPTTTESSRDPSGAEPLFDCFPLQFGRIHSYHFTWESYIADGYITWSYEHDSGRVQYVVLDSTSLNDSTIGWSILEIHDFRTTRGPTPDTTYQVSDTASLTLYEKTLGRHELSCTTGIIWSFPLGHLRGLIHEPLFRYMDSSSVRLSWYWHNPPGYYIYGTGTDSLKMDDSLGFTTRKLRDSWESGYLSGVTRIEVFTEYVTVGVPERPDEIPLYTHLAQNYPNPFNPNTTISYQLPAQTHVMLKIYDLLGREVATLVNEVKPPGSYEATWNGSNVASGVYFYRLQAGDFAQTRKLVLMK